MIFTLTDQNQRCLYQREQFSEAAALCRHSERLEEMNYAIQNSLRDIVENISAQAHRLYHLGSEKLLRSNLSRINDSKPYALYEALFGKLLDRCQSVVPGYDFRFKNPLYSLDASTIDLCLSVFPWADFRSTKGAVKLHSA